MSDHIAGIQDRYHQAIVSAVAFFLTRLSFNQNPIKSKHVMGMKSYTFFTGETNLYGFVHTHLGLKPLLKRFPHHVLSSNRNHLSMTRNYPIKIQLQNALD